MRFRGFWPIYLRQHAHPANRALHIAGTAAALGLLTFAATERKAWPVPAALAVGYGAAWIGHAVFEQNRPATFEHPLLSLAGDLVMVAHAMTGRPELPHE